MTRTYLKQFDKVDTREKYLFWENHSRFSKREGVFDLPVQNLERTEPEDDTVGKPLGNNPYFREDKTRTQECDLLGKGILERKRSWISI